MSLSDFAYAPAPQQAKTEARPSPSVSQQELNLIAENARLQEVNVHLHAVNQDLKARAGSTKKVACLLAVALIVVLVVSYNAYNSLQSVRRQLDMAQQENNMLSSQVATLQAKVNTMASAPAASTSITRTKSASAPAVVMVYVTPSGKRYHDSARCAGYDPDCIPLSEAKSKGYTPCKTCKPSD